MSQETLNSTKVTRNLSCLLIILLVTCIYSGIVQHSTSAQASGAHLIVAQDGSGNYTSIQSAVDAIPAGNPNHTVIYIKSGTYKEIVTVPANKPYVTFFGQDENNTIITYDNYHNKQKPGGGTYGTDGSASVFIAGDHFTAIHVTFQNTAGRVGQAVALSVSADAAYFSNCKFHGWQDTLYAKSGRQYYSNSYIDGNIDYVFGDATATFENTEFYNLGGNGGAVTAQKRSSASETTGFVLSNDTFDGAVPNAVYLGRPWGPYGRVIVMNSQLGADIVAAGWKNWSTADYHLTAYFAEFNNTGPGASTANRISWSHQLTGQETQQYSVDAFLNQDGWLTNAKQALNALIATGFLTK